MPDMLRQPPFVGRYRSASLQELRSSRKYTECGIQAAQWAERARQKSAMLFASLSFRDAFVQNPDGELRLLFVDE